MLNVCPYCRAVQPKEVTRKIKCKSCSKIIYRKSTPDNREKRLMTELQAQEAEKQWNHYNTVIAPKNRLRELAGWFEIKPVDSVEELIIALMVNCSVLPPLDMNRRDMEMYLSANGPENLRQQYYRDFQYHEILRIQERWAASQSWDGMLQIIGGAQGCESCRSINHTTMRIEQAIKQLWPNPNCEHLPRHVCAMWGVYLGKP